MSSIVQASSKADVHNEDDIDNSATSDEESQGEVKNECKEELKYEGDLKNEVKAELECGLTAEDIENMVCRRSNRARKQTQYFKIVDVPVKVNHSTPEGEGQKLSDIPFTESMLDRLKTDDEVMKRLHKCMYGSEGIKTTRKRKVKAWCGVDPNTHDESIAKMQSILLLTKSNQLLKEMCKVCGIESTGKKSDIVERLTNYLQKPRDLKKSVPSTSKRRKQSQSKSPISKHTKPKTDGPPKKPPTAFFLFNADRRPSLREENPELPITEIHRMLGSEWQTLPPDDKLAYEEKAEELKKSHARIMEDYVNEHPGYSKKTRKSKQDKVSTKRTKTEVKSIKEVKEEESGCEEANEGTEG